jgi:putative glutamine amidotransferase
LYLLEQAQSMELPFLGICRGLQLINVGLGGSLYEHILEQHEGALQHQYSPDWPRDYLAHSVQVRRDSLLGNILGVSELHVNSLHHQGVKELAPRLRATAYAPDGLLEAFELPDFPFGLAVQWHPEWLLGQPSSRALFQAFVAACKPEQE